MGSGFAIGYINFTIFLLLFSGLLILLLDVKNYRTQNMKKEQKTARVLGWFHITVGVATFLGNWVYQTYF